MDFLTANFLETASVVSHVAAGFTALVMAPLAMMTQKGGNQHRRWGKIYFWAMFAIFVTALALVYFRPNFFLFMISILSFYGAFTGYRALYRKRPERGEGPIWLDWLGAGIAAVAGLVFLLWGGLTAIGLLVTQIPPVFGLIGVGFGVSLCGDAIGDMRTFLQPSTDRNWWWYYHIQRMSGSYIAAVTAFTVQNVTRLMPDEVAWLPWVLPALIGTPLIARSVRHYRQKFENRRLAQTASALAEVG
ncbi:MAG: hypothetical protein DWI57_06180 [Chloroflexi bacterium]|nr:MAG: hypothetical protein DWI57_06180 [Chloroflexota bacterium]